MERVIRPYGAQEPVNLARPVPHGSPQVALPAKTVSELFRAVRRGFPIIVVLTTLAGVLGSSYVMKLPAVYRSVGHVQIEPPRFNEHIAVILGGNAIPTNDREVSEKFVPNRLAWLQSRNLASEVIGPGEMGVGRGFEANPEAEILTNISHRRFQPGTNIFEIALEGSDPERVTKLLTVLLERFQLKVHSDSAKALENAKVSSERSIKDLEEDIKSDNEEIQAVIKATPVFGPDGTHLLLAERSMLKSILNQKKSKHEDLKHEDRIHQLYPMLAEPPPSMNSRKLELVQERIDYYQEQLEQAARLIRSHNLDSDPASRRWAKLLERAMNDLEELKKRDVRMELPDHAQLALAHSEEELRQLARQEKGVSDQIQATMPDYDHYQSLLADRDSKRKQLAGIKEKLSQFLLVSNSKPEPVTIIQAPTEPGGPSRPNRPMLIGMLTMAGFLLGLGLVAGREYIDRSVKVPEHLSLGLSLPILSVIPRMRRLAQLQRGGHLWTAKAPLSHEADSYRNLRAGLIGTAGPKGRITTVLITSAKPGEGKSTTALNLALTCARAGERTLLIDADLRRPSLAEVFDATEPNVGLVDVLRGDMPWQRAVVQSDIPSLDFLPTGDTSGVPIEILGTLELRQLIAAVSGQFQRVIIDAPSILGLADCRMLGRTVDASILVVRSGTHAMLTLRRAKEMLQQSHVPIAGVVFNGLTDDLDNWSSHFSALTSAAPARGGELLVATREEAPLIEA